jgi:N-acetyl-gamma-glutamylphosphate reductase
MRVIDSASSSNPSVLKLLQSHPEVLAATEGSNLLEFIQGERTRQVLQGAIEEPTYGLVELMDNNPLVCADRISIPTAASALALIALGPLLLAGAILRPPILHLNVASTQGDVLSSLRAVAPLEQLRLVTPSEDPSIGQSVEASIFGKLVPAEGMLAGQASVEIPLTTGLNQLTEMFAERFGRSFYVRNRTGTGHVRPLDELVGKPYALYTLQVMRGASSNYALIEVSADPNGKPGAAGLVHAMNIMAGLEESLGIPA